MMAPSALLADLGEHARQLAGSVEVNVAQPEPELLRALVRRLLVGGQNARVPRVAPQHGDAREARVELAQHLQPLAHDLGRVALHAGDVAAGPGEARHDPRIRRDLPPPR
jgi:hypothetical protein